MQAAIAANRAAAALCFTPHINAVGQGPLQPELQQLAFDAQQAALVRRALPDDVDRCVHDLQSAQGEH